MKKSLKLSLMALLAITGLAVHSYAANKYPKFTIITNDSAMINLSNGRYGGLKQGGGKTIIDLNKTKYGQKNSKSFSVGYHHGNSSCNNVLIKNGKTYNCPKS